MPLTTRVLAGLLAGIGLGLIFNASHSPGLIAAGLGIEPVGTLWVNGILMTVIPLVVSSLVVAVSSATDSRQVGRLGWRAVVLFFALACFAAGFTAIVVPPLMAWLPIDASAIASLRVAPGIAASQPLPATTIGQWITALVPANPIKAAADGAMLPLVIFTLAFALAITTVPLELRRTLVQFFQAVAMAMRSLVEWVLALAPIGVFALALPLTIRHGASAAGALGFYVVVVVAICIVILLLLYPFVATVGRVSMKRFAYAAAPAQMVAFSARSSLASLPALIEGAEQRLGLPKSVSGFCLPLAVSIFKIGAPIVTVTGLVFISRLYGVEIEPARFAQAVALAALLSFATPGVPAGGLLVSAPMFVAAGLPVEGIGLLVALDTIPDMFRAPVNVTADLAVATILASRSPETGKSAPAGP